MNPAKDIIARLGGEAQVSFITGTAYTAPYRWQAARGKGGTGGVIPQRHHRKLLDHARAKGIPLSAEEFLPACEVAAGEETPGMMTTAGEGNCDLAGSFRFHSSPCDMPADDAAAGMSLLWPSPSEARPAAAEHFPVLTINGARLSPVRAGESFYCLPLRAGSDPRARHRLRLFVRAARRELRRRFARP